MDLLIKHGTWVIVLVVPVLIYVYLHVSMSMYAFRIARRLNEEDAGGELRKTVRVRTAVPARPIQRRAPATSTR